MSNRLQLIFRTY